MPFIRYDWEQWFKDRLCKLSCEERILDVGGGHPFQKRMAQYQHLFEGKRYETLDNSPRYHPTIVGDAHHIPLPDASVNAVLSLSTLEHLEDPKRAVEELHRVLASGGKALIYTHFIYPYHARGGVYGDYFRFTEEALRFLFRQFRQVELKKQGGYFRAMFFFTPFQRYTRPLGEPIAYVLDKVFKTEYRSTTAGYYVYAVK